MSTLHILVDTEKEMIVNALHEGQMEEKRGLQRFVKHYQDQAGYPLARVIVKKGSPVKVIQAGEEKI